VEGDRLDRLNGLLKIDLPPLKSYKALAKMEMSEKAVNLSELEVRVNRSQLTGKMTLNRAKSRPTATVDLKAPLVQLNDFMVGKASAKGDESRRTNEKTDTGMLAEETSEKAAKDKGETEKAKAAVSKEGEGEREAPSLFSPEVLGRADVMMNVEVQEVLSGDDKLGSGSLKATLKEGRISLDPIKLNLPGGSLSLAMSLKPGHESSDASVKVLAENFDFGVLVRRADPKSDMGGTLNLNVELASTAKAPEEILANSSGHLNFSGKLENLQAGIMDLWAVNIIAAIVTKDKKGSEINCIVGRWGMKDGLLSPEVFLIDTEKLRICATGKVDFKKRFVDLKAAPTPKKPEFFSLATPLEVKGKFSDFEVGIASGGLVGTIASFITSPLHVPIRRLAGEGLPEDGNDVCGIPIGPDDRHEMPLPGCRSFQEKE